ncbi:hypothetical protein DSO57_1031994 [Entomophthora muscae]|uniref:Uncharacterized protein n=1 Tax=Entomophthora muscae TaxID=34485 RepID=A0ACC2S2N1_9FUNG|nr:hypothetical protein DSO57_1031994 [Entomophthora muscae]
MVEVQLVRIQSVRIWKKENVAVLFNVELRLQAEMTPFQQQIFDSILLLAGVVAMAANVLLIWILRRLRLFSVEIKLTAALAVVDLAIAILVVFTSISNIWFSDISVAFLAFCRIKGPIDYFLLLFSPLLVALIALERYCRVVDSNISRVTWRYIGGCALLYICLVLSSAVMDGFSVSASGCDCSASAADSVLSAIVAFTLGFFMFVSLLVAIWAYLGILCYVDKARLNQECFINISRKKIRIRVISASVTYFVTIAPYAILLMLEGLRTPIPLDELDIIISLLIAFNLIINPCLILFSHSLISENLKRCFRNSPPQKHETNPFPHPLPSTQIPFQ